MESNDNIPWNEIIKKEALGINDADLGKIQEVGSDSILTKKGIINTKIVWYSKGFSRKVFFLVYSITIIIIIIIIIFVSELCNSILILFMLNIK